MTDVAKSLSCPLVTIQNTGCAFDAHSCNSVVTMQVMQEIESHWISGRKLPDGVCSPMAGSNHTILHACLATVNAALACRHRGIHSVQVCLKSLYQPATQAQNPTHAVQYHVSLCAVLCAFLAETWQYLNFGVDG